jgi:RNA polymerase sigma factor (sigma-70 family)
MATIKAAGIKHLSGYPSPVLRSIINYVQETKINKPLAEGKESVPVLRHPRDTWNILLTPKNLSNLIGIAIEMHRKWGKRAGVSFEDIKAYCLEGLIAGATLFNEDLDIQLASFARNEVMGRIQQAIRHECLPERTQPMSIEDICPRSQKTLKDMLPANGSDPEHILLAAAREKTIERLQTLISDLDAMDQDIIRSHFGFDDSGGKKTSRDEIGSRYGVSRETIRTREKEILDKLRKQLL